MPARAYLRSGSRLTQIMERSGAGEVGRVIFLVGISGGVILPVEFRLSEVARAEIMRVWDGRRWAILGVVTVSSFR